MKCGFNSTRILSSSCSYERYEFTQEEHHNKRNKPLQVKTVTKKTQATEERRGQGEIELHSLEKENEGIENNSGKE